MTSPGQNHLPDRVRNAEETLRLLATRPAPEGLVDRVQARLAVAPPPSFLSNWSPFGRNGWMFGPVLRGCAAAAIVVLVAGGGFAIYSHVQPSPSAKVIEMPARVGNSGGFSNAGAMRTPDTLNGPVLAHPVLAASRRSSAAERDRAAAVRPPQSQAGRQPQESPGETSKIARPPGAGCPIQALLGWERPQPHRHLPPSHL